MKKLQVVIPLAFMFWFTCGCQNQEAAKIEEQNMALIKHYIEERFAKMWFGASPDLDWEIQNMITKDDEVSVEFVVSGTRMGESPDTRTTGERFMASKTIKFRIQDGKIVEEWKESDMLAFMQQLLGIKLNEKDSDS